MNFVWLKHRVHGSLQLTFLHDVLDLVVGPLVNPVVDHLGGFSGLAGVDLGGFRAEGSAGQLLVVRLELQVVGEVHLVGDLQGYVLDVLRWSLKSMIIREIGIIVKLLRKSREKSTYVEGVHEILESLLGDGVVGGHMKGLTHLDGGVTTGT